MITREALFLVIKQLSHPDAFKEAEKQPCDALTVVYYRVAAAAKLNVLESLCYRVSDGTTGDTWCHGNTSAYIDRLCLLCVTLNPLVTVEVEIPCSVMNRLNLDCDGLTDSYRACERVHSS